MSILTKICVVILALLNLLSVPVFITQATVHASWKRAYEKQAGYIKVLKVQHGHVQLALQQATAELNKCRASLSEVRDQKNLEVGRLQTQLGTEKSINARLSNSLDERNVNQLELNKTLAIEVKRRVLSEQQLAVVRIENISLKVTRRRIEDALKKAQAEQERLGKVVRALREQMVDTEERIKELEKMLAGAPKKKTEAAVEEIPQIDGTVMSVKGDLAGINIGSAKGIKPRMKLIVYRGSQFVAHLRVQDVGIRDAAGVLFDKRLEPLRGDKVTTTLRQ